MTIARIRTALLEEAGWQPGTSLENRAMHRFRQWKVTDCRQQHRVGRYRLDFAFPDVHIAIELDGWHHGSDEGLLRDARRDAWLRDQGWTVLRVADIPDDELFCKRLFEAVLIVKARRMWDR